jgi:type II secretory ATPase GspE/PulE/Tfp pilus assembly ATPase PilB-like protein
MPIDSDAKRPSAKVNLEQLDVQSFSKDKIRDLFRTGGVPTSDTLLDEILLQAVRRGATDVHVEPFEKELRIRIGIGGVMKRLVTLPPEISENLVNVIKTRGKVNAFEKKKPQEGRFSGQIGGQQCDVRVSTMPILTGERLALRIQSNSARVSGIERLEFSPENLARFKAMLQKPSGLFLVAGPPVSGKSTTLYAALDALKSPEKNIITIENAIEYPLEFASQVVVSGDGGLMFSEAIKSILRQNPSVIMIGEIKDGESAVAACEAAHTGYLVLSSIQSNSAIDAIFRLRDFGVPPYNLASTLIGIVYQRLVRRICEKCREAYFPDAEELGLIGGETAKKQENFFRGTGCDACEKTGYLGRLPVQEMLTMGDVVRDLVFQGASPAKLTEALQQSGFDSLRSDTMRKMAAGLTSIAEFARTMG